MSYIENPSNSFIDMMPKGAGFTITDTYLQVATVGNGQWNTNYNYYPAAAVSIPNQEWITTTKISYFDDGTQDENGASGLCITNAHADLSNREGWTLSWIANRGWYGQQPNKLCVFRVTNGEPAIVAVAAGFVNPNTIPIYLRAHYSGAGGTIVFRGSTDEINWTTIYGPVSCVFTPTFVGVYSMNCFYGFNPFSAITGRYNEFSVLWGSDLLSSTPCSVPSIDGNFTLNHYYCLRNQYLGSSREGNPIVAPFSLDRGVVNTRNQVSASIIKGENSR